MRDLLYKQSHEFPDAPLVGATEPERDRSWQVTKEWSRRPDLEWTSGVMPERFTAMTGRVPGYVYEDIESYETARVLLRIGSNLIGLRANLSLIRFGVVSPSLGAYPTIALGFRYFDSMYRSRDGHLRMPTKGDRFRGRHYVVPIDHDDWRTIKFMNSWAPTWGDHSYGYIDEEYFNAHVETVFARWSGVTGPSPTMSQWLDRADESGVGYPRSLQVCWAAPNNCTVFEVELRRRAHSVLHWRTLSLERSLPVDAFELRNGARIIGRLHVEHARDNSVITELFVLPAFRCRGYGRFLGQLAAESARDHGAAEIEAWLRRGDDREPAVAGANALAAAIGYEWKPTPRERPTLVATATRRLK